MSYFFVIANKLHAKLCGRLSRSLWRHGRGLAGAGDISHRRFLGWWPALRCSFLHWSLPVLQQWSFPLVASNCSVWSSAWLYLNGWWDWSFGSSGTAAGSLSWEVWWPRTGSTGWPFSSLPDRIADCRESGDYVLSTCSGQFWWDVVHSIWLPFLQWLYLSLHFFAKDEVVVVLCVCLGAVQYWWISVCRVTVHLRAEFCPSDQYLSFFLRRFPERSWIG